MSLCAHLSSGRATLTVCHQSRGLGVGLGAWGETSLEEQLVGVGKMEKHGICQEEARDVGVLEKVFVVCRREAGGAGGCECGWR